MARPVRTYHIALDIQTVAPLQVSPLEQGTYDPQTRRIMRYVSPDSGIRCALTMTTSLAHAAAAHETEDGQQRVSSPRVPIIPSSTVLGGLRRAATDILIDGLLPRGLKISSDIYNTLATGAAATSLETSDRSPHVVAAQRDDAFLALFGGTVFALPSAIVVSDGLPIHTHTLPMLASPALVDPTLLSPYQMTEALSIVRRNDLMDARRADLADVLGVDELARYVESEGARRVESVKNKAASRKGEGEAAKKTDLRTVNAFEAAVPGLPFALRLTTRAYSPAQLGLLLLGLQSLLRRGQFGGHASRGCGRYKLSASALYSVDSFTGVQTFMGSLFSPVPGLPFDAVQDDQQVEEALSAAQQYLANTSVERLAALSGTDARAFIGRPPRASKGDQASAS